jgi:signal transduction histidine kinase
LDRTPFWTCYDAQGTAVGSSAIAHAVPQFSATSIVTAAIHSGDASDTVSGGSDFGTIRRYAMTVHDSSGNLLGTVVVGTQIGGELNALHLLLELLLVLGGLALLCASLGGLFLANRALEPARIANARQRDFIADASHELRTPLTMLRADAEVLLRGRDRLAPDDVALLEDVVTEASHMGSLANHMLDLARLDAGELRLDQDVVDLAVLAGDVGRRAGPLAAEHHVSIRLENAGPALVVGDPLWLEHTLLILVDNAIKYNRPGGEVVVRTSVTDHQATLHVGDTGIGIAPEHLPHLGERFFRVDKARSREAGGAGLGISIAQNIAARHGGTLQLSSEPGQGTTATLTLPAARTTQQSSAAG